MHRQSTNTNLSGPEHLADIFGTEKDRVNCPFYWKIGACRHGERCTRTHNKPVCSQTILIPHMYPNPISTPVFDAQGNQVEYGEDFLREHFDDFYEDVWDELSKYGQIDELIVVDNICEHLVGNVYAKFYSEEDAEKALKNLNGRYYAGRMLMPEFSPVTNFREARCKQYESGTCSRGGLCNFMHLKKIGKELARQLFGSKRSRRRDDYYYRDRRYRSRSRDRDVDDDRRRYRSRSRDRDDDRRRRHRSRSRDRDEKKSKRRSRSKERRHRSRSRSEERKSRKSRDDRKKRERSADRDEDRDAKKQKASPQKEDKPTDLNQPPEENKH